MNTRHLVPAAAVLIALVGLVVLAGGGAVATGLSAGHTPPSSCRPATTPTPTPTPTGSGPAGPSPSATPTPSAASGPRAAFAAAYLTRIAAPTSPANLTFLTAWMTAESGPDTGSPTLSAARYNPLNTTRPAPGSWPFNSAGVQNYPTLDVGVTASADTTLAPPYAGLLAALRAGTDAVADAQALAASPWGTGTLVLQILAAGSSTTCTPPPAVGDVAAVIAFAQGQLGKPYQWAAAGPDRYDCSGLTMTAYATIGISLPHNAALQSGYGTRVPSQALLLPGDLVFFGAPIHHVGLYTGNGQMIDAPHTGAVVRYDPLWSDYSGAVRLVTPSDTPSARP
jgi:cell wall-associated NlpC family hydrolase